MRKYFNTKKRIVAGVLSVAILAATAGIAAAYFTAGGTGTGSATVGSSTPWTVSQTGSSGGPLLPNGATSDVTLTFTVTNGGTSAQSYNSLASNVDSSSTFITTGPNKTAVTGCLAAWFTATKGTPSVAAGTPVAVGGNFTETVVVDMPVNGTNQDLCQATTPNINLVVS